MSRAILNQLTLLLVNAINFWEVLNLSPPIQVLLQEWQKNYHQTKLKDCDRSNFQLHHTSFKFDLTKQLSNILLHGTSKIGRCLD